MIKSTQKTPSTSPLTTKVDPAMRSAVLVAARAMNISPAALIRRALAEFLNRDDSVRGKLTADFGLTRRVELLESRLDGLERLDLGQPKSTRLTHD